MECHWWLCCAAVGRAPLTETIRVLGNLLILGFLIGTLVQHGPFAISNKSIRSAFSSKIRFKAGVWPLWARSCSPRASNPASFPERDHYHSPHLVVSLTLLGSCLSLLPAPALPCPSNPPRTLAPSNVAVSSEAKAGKEDVAPTGSVGARLMYTLLMNYVYV